MAPSANPTAVAVTVSATSSAVTWTSSGNPANAVTVVLMESSTSGGTYTNVASTSGKIMSDAAATVTYTAINNYWYYAVVNNTLAGGTSTAGPTVSTAVQYISVAPVNVPPTFTITSLTNTQMSISWTGGDQVSTVLPTIIYANNSAMTGASTYYTPSTSSGNSGTKTMTTPILEGYWYSINPLITYLGSLTEYAVNPAGILLREVPIVATGGTITTATVGGIKYRTHAFTSALTEDFAYAAITTFQYDPTWNGWTWSPTSTGGGIAKNGVVVTGAAGNSQPYFSFTTTNSAPYQSSVTSPVVLIPSGRTMTLTFLYSYNIATATPNVLSVTYNGTGIYTTTTFSATDWVMATATFTTTSDSGQFVFTQGNGANVGNALVLITGIKLSENFTVVSPAKLNVNSLIVGGGGGGGANVGDGGGAGGAVLTTNAAVTPGAYAVIVGSGGGVSRTQDGIGGSGGNSTFNSVTGTGGGGGGNLTTAGLNGGCGGGGHGTAGTGSQGYNGGQTSGVYSGGGGGMGSVGLTNSSDVTRGGAGGAGATYTIGGVSYLVAGGGGGAGYFVFGGLGGSGIGGNGALITNTGLPGPSAPGTAPVTNTGSGGGGGNPSTEAATAGASGVVYISYVVSPEATGGTITYKNVNGVIYETHTFTSSGTFAIAGAVELADVLVVGGGGGGGTQYVGGGGGAGGAVRTTSTLTGGSYAVTVGLGGTGSVIITPGSSQTLATNGGDSTFNSITGTGGGRGGNYPDTLANTTGGNGGCGGGSSGQYNALGGTGSQGFRGGNGTTPGSGGGGGGMGGQGSDGVPPGFAGPGGAGATYTLGGNSYLVSGGGGTIGDYNGETAGGIGGGGRGGNPGVAGTPNTGGGGGGSYLTSGGAGGSGLVVISFPIYPLTLNPDLTPFKPRSPVGRSDYYKHTGRGMPRYMTEWMDSLIV